jgi:hypothetical protein
MPKILCVELPFLSQDKEAPADIKSTDGGSGLEWDYAMTWSYAPRDAWRLISPTIMGGSSQMEVDKDLPIHKFFSGAEQTSKSLCAYLLGRCRKRGWTSLCWSHFLTSVDSWVLCAQQEIVLATFCRLDAPNLLSHLVNTLSLFNAFSSTIFRNTPLLERTILCLLL